MFKAELASLVEGAFSLLTSRDADRSENAKRLIAYLRAESELIQEYLVNNSWRNPQRDEDFRMVGNCLRDPEGIANFFRACNPQRLYPDHVRTIAELVRYRSNALQHVPTDQLNQIYETIAEEFRSNFQAFKSKSSLSLPDTMRRLSAAAKNIRRLVCSAR